MAWIEYLKAEDVMLHATPVQILDWSDEYTIDDAAHLMLNDSPRYFAALKDEDKLKLIKGTIYTRSADNRPPKSYWTSVKSEFHLFFCTDDKRYDKLRKQLDEAVTPTSTAIISIISAFIGDMVGVEAGVIVGLIAVCLYGVLKVGKEAYCAIAHNK
uniref:hypothetical protein n=1 Tax=Ningiella ruwaisensis TaxID=2364274 RepID=UPI00109F4239|nr:hypothetical protein [Ningiella ruwaisensis]